MLHASVKTFEFGGEWSEEVDRVAAVAVQAAADKAAEVAQASASIDLKLVIVPAHVDPKVDGYSAGINSTRTSDVEGSTTPLATIFDGGSLGRRRRALRRPRKRSWTQHNPGSTDTHTATRGEISGKGIKPQYFFAKARTAGKAELLEQVARELT